MHKQMSHVVHMPHWNVLFCNYAVGRSRNIRDNGPQQLRIAFLPHLHENANLAWNPFVKCSVYTIQCDNFKIWPRGYKTFFHAQLNCAWNFSRS